MKLSEMTKHEGGRYHDGSNFLPWYTSPCLEWLMTLDLLGKRIWEYGVGDSSAWYRSKNAKVSGVDTDKVWAEKCGAHHAEDPEYYRASILGTGEYDIIVIDGIERDECTRFALDHLKLGGYLILDNYHQPTVEPNWPLTDKLIEGMPIQLFYEPGHWDRWCTAVIQKPL
jgi:hypothetical protein